MVFAEFASCSRRGFVRSVLIGGAAILAFAFLSVMLNISWLLQLGLVVGLAGARWIEAAFSHTCPWPQVALESGVLALIGVVLVAADTLLPLG